MPHPCEKVFLSRDLADQLGPKDDESKNWAWINDMGEDLLVNREIGQKVPRRLWPDEYVHKYGINNLYRYEHPERCRSCYTLVHTPGIGICANILDLLTHPEYDELFGYK